MFFLVLLYVAHVFVSALFLSIALFLYHVRSPKCFNFVLTFSSLGLAFHDSGRSILSPFKLSLVPLASQNPDFGRVHTGFLIPDLCRVYSRGFVSVDYLIRPPINIYFHPLFLRTLFTLYIRGALGNHISHGHCCRIYGYCGTPLAAFRYDPYCAGGIWLLYTGGGGGYWFPLLGALCAAFARIHRRSDNSPSDLILGRCGYC